MGISNLGIFHTLIGVIAIIAGLISFVSFSKINLATLSGKIYFYGTLITSFTALGFTKHGRFNPGHVFSLLIAALAIIAFVLHRQNGSKARYFENFLLSLTFFLSLVPTVNETLTRVPIGHPLAAAPTDPIIKQILLVFLLLFIAGSVFQFIRQRKINGTY